MLTSGTKLGRYEIRSKIGEGGMGAVYRARDTELGRDVALKVLPSAFAHNAERLHRFQQEACAAGALNHPNILVVHDIGSHDNFPFVVSELLEGETLRQRLSGSALPQHRSIDYALQIAHGLAAAHERGIIHRDLKPDNIFITSDGRVKILDFGLAKLTGNDSGDRQTDIPTRRVDTDSGVVMGTVGYMSPEQIRGRSIDQRSDIFAFGAVLYEMLSGRRAFHGESAADTMSAILKEEPVRISTAVENISPGLERVVHHCLEKNPQHRFHSARDVAFALESISETASVTISAATQKPARKKLSERFIWIAITAMLLLVSIVAIAYNFLRTRTEKLDPVRFNVSLPDQSTFFIDIETHNVSLSPDGRNLAFIATRDGKRTLWIRSLGDLGSEALDGTQGAYSPFWSPDSRYVAFFAEGKLKRIDTSGGATQTICNLSGEIATVGTWGSSGEILFSDQLKAIFRVPASGGTPTVVLKVEKEILGWVNFLPDGKTFLFYRQGGQSQENGIYVSSMDSTSQSLVLSTPSTRVEYALGYLIYSREGSLMAHSFDPKTLRVTGEPLVLVQRVPYFDKTGWTEFSTSTNGTIAYLGNVLTGRLVWFDRNGREIEQVGTPNAYGGFRLSPDGKSLLLSVFDQQTGSGDLWIHDFARKVSSRFVYGPADDHQAVWSPDGRRVAFFSCCEKPATLYVKELNETGKGQLLASGFSVPWDWSADGRFLAYSQNDPDSYQDIWVLPFEGERKSYALLQSEFNETYAKFSPNGRWVAYVSNESGSDDIYVAGFDNPKQKWRVSQSGGTQPYWRRDGKELFYFSLDGQLMAVPVSSGDSFESGSAVPLFKLASIDNLRYDINADGQSFLIAVNDRSALQTSFTVVINWPTDLKR